MLFRSSAYPQPTGYNFSSTQRTYYIPVTQDDIDNDEMFEDNFFGHLSLTAFSCSYYGYQVSGADSSSFAKIDLSAGVESDSKVLSPEGQYNAIGYNTQNGFIYGYAQHATVLCSISDYAVVTLLAPVANLPTTYSAGTILYNVGSVSPDVHLYLYYSYYLDIAESRIYYVVDVNCHSPKYLYLVDPTNDYAIQTETFGIPIEYLNIRDWGFNPLDNKLYAVGTLYDVTSEDTAPIYRFDPETSTITTLTADSFAEGIPTMTKSPSTGEYLNTYYGAVFFALGGNLYAINNTNGNIYRAVVDAEHYNYTASLFSHGSASTNNDGARCAYSPINTDNPPLDIIKDTNKTAALMGSTITYTLLVYNPSSLAHDDAIITDAIPSGTTFLPDSVTVDGKATSGDIATGISLGNLAPYSTTTVTFKVKVDNETTLEDLEVRNYAAVTASNMGPSVSNIASTWVYNGSRGIPFI